MSIGDEGAQNGFGQNPISADPRLPPLVTTFGWVSYRWAICFGTAYLGSSCIGFTLVCGPFNSCAWWWLVESVFHQHLWNSLVNHSYHPVNAYLSCVYAGVDSVKTGLTTVINTPPPHLAFAHFSCTCYHAMLSIIPHILMWTWQENAKLLIVVGL